MKRLARAFAFAVVVTLACRDATAPPVPGTLTIELTTPHSDDRAILFRVSGPTAVSELTTASSGYVLYERASDGQARAAVFGDLTNGALATFSVPDVARFAEYTATVLEVSDEVNAVRAGLVGYQLAIRR